MIVVINFSEHYPHTEELQSWLTSPWALTQLLMMMQLSKLTS